MFNPEIECTVSKVMEELEQTLDPMDILEKACPICPKRPPSGKTQKNLEQTYARACTIFTSLIAFLSFQ